MFIRNFTERKIHNKMETTERMLPIDSPMSEFYDHLSYNKRIIFSAKFGDGKTYFLKEFIEKDKEEYLFITIYPVNYQVEENKDIFEHIKRDILFQLCKEQLINDKIDVNTIIRHTFNKSNITELVDFFNQCYESHYPRSSLNFPIIKKNA